MVRGGPRDPIPSPLGTAVGLLADVAGGVGWIRGHHGLSVCVKHIWRFSSKVREGPSPGYGPSRRRCSSGGFVSCVPSFDSSR